MTDRTIRLLEPGEYRAATDMFRLTLHTPAISDTDWERARQTFQDGRSFGAVEGDAVVGLARSVDSALMLPGGAQVPMAAVTGVGVRPDRTRRGVMTELIRAQLDEIAERDVPVAALHASEAEIYGRFGYGVATVSRTFRVNRRRAKVRPTAPTGGEIELYDLEEAIGRMPEIYAPLATLRHGMMERPAYLWPSWVGHYRRSEGVMRLAVHRNGAGVGGFAAYRVHNPWPADGESVLYVEDMVYATPEAFADLWRYLVGVDLVDSVVADMRPVDEPVPALFTDMRAAATTDIDDELWVRILDVSAVLGARRFSGDDSVVLEVADQLRPGNSGRYRVSADGVVRTVQPPGIRLDVAELAMLALGGWRACALAEAGRLDVADPDAVVAADRLFSTDRSPWCGTFF